MKLEQKSILQIFIVTGIVILLFFSVVCIVQMSRSKHNIEGWLFQIEMFQINYGVDAPSSYYSNLASSRVEYIKMRNWTLITATGLIAFIVFEILYVRSVEKPPQYSKVALFSQRKRRSDFIDLEDNNNYLSSKEESI